MYSNIIWQSSTMQNLQLLAVNVHQLNIKWIDGLSTPSHGYWISDSGSFFQRTQRNWTQIRKAIKSIWHRMVPVSSDITETAIKPKSLEKYVPWKKMKFSQVIEFKKLYMKLHTHRHPNGPDKTHFFKEVGINGDEFHKRQNIFPLH